MPPDAADAEAADELRSTITLVTDEVDRMNRLVEDLLVLARAERPGFLSPEPVDVAKLTAEVHRKASVLCDRAWPLDEVAHVVADVDAQLLTQAMLQLAQNACQHTAPGTPVHIGSRVADATLVLWVHDRGPGIPPENAARIFTRFVKDPAHLDGSGLGLSIVTAIAQAHNGRHTSPPPKPAPASRSPSPAFDLAGRCVRQRCRKYGRTSMWPSRATESVTRSMNDSTA